MPAIDLDAAVATYWSGMRVGVTDADVVAAWTAAADAVTWGEGWPNPSFGADALRHWSSRGA